MILLTTEEEPGKPDIAYQMSRKVGWHRDIPMIAPINLLEIISLERRFLFSQTICKL